MTRSSLRWIALAAALAAAPAHALFGDDEARKAINDLTKRVDARLAKIEQDLADKVDRRSMLDLNASLEAIRGDLAALRGQIEVLHNRVEQSDKRQRDLYVDLDNRLRKFEVAGAEKEKAAQAQAAEQQAYEAGLAQMKANNYGAAIQSLQGFMTQYPNSTLAPSAQYWIGNAHYALRDFKSAIAAQQRLVATWPENSRAPDALLNIASSQAEMGEQGASSNTLKTLVAKYPGSPAAEQARQRLAKTAKK
jgi:tol-pal system protein YbgF